jgi:hypothetical protein
MHEQELIRILIALIKRQGGQAVSQDELDNIKSTERLKVKPVNDEWGGYDLTIENVEV